MRWRWNHSRATPTGPIVTRSVYNCQNPVPTSLPDNKTKSALRSSPDSNGFNDPR
ncbi:MAG TPA: hypothetical protein VFZ09_18765 [Archangium sp.]|nr:hypothetical protein [Archangium sp.]